MLRHVHALVATAVLVLALAAPADARGRGSTSRAGTRKATSSVPRKAAAKPKAAAEPKAARTKAAQSNRPKCSACTRDAKGRIARSATATRDYRKSHPCPATGKTSGACPGYVIDHVVPLKRGGADAPGNMQWQTAAAAKAKDKVE
jgi:hypothetical protein